jgi:arylsulfatase A-like enzyme
MRRTSFLLLPAALVLALSLGLFTVWNRPPRLERPDLLLITIDTLRADRVGAYGYPQARTPVLDGLAADGVVFLQATTPFPRTTPGLASLLTGLEPSHHGSREVAQPMSREVTTLGQILQRQGYATVGASANGAAGEHQGLDRGFDRFLRYADLLPPVAPVVTERTLAAVAEVSAEKPLFLWVHYIDPHFPYRPPPEFAAADQAPHCRALQARLARDPWGIAEVQQNWQGVAAAVRDECSELYDAEIAATDFSIGQLLAGLQRLRPGRQALTVLTADHGENLGEDGLFFEHGPSVHDAGLRVPLILSGPGIPRRRDQRGARLQDVLPTLLSLLRLPAAERPAIDGEDLSPRLRPLAWSPFGAPDPPTFAESGSALLPNVFNRVHSGRTHELNCLNAPRFSLCGRPGEEPGLFEPAVDSKLEQDLSASYPVEKAALMAARQIWPPEQARQRALREGRFKLVEVPLWRGGYRRALYDLAADPGETQDIKHLFGAQYQRLSRRLEAWTAQLPTAALGERSPEQLEALRSLGYAR